MEGMDVRTAEGTDWNAIRDLAERSFGASYSLSPDQIAIIVDRDFSEEVLTERLQNPEHLVFVAEGEVEANEGIFGFADVELDDVPTLRWLHVDPIARGRGIGTELFERVREDTAEMGQSDLTARILEDAVEGGDFLEKFGYYRTDSTQLEFEGRTFAEQLYTKGDAKSKANEPTVEVPDRVTIDGDRHPVDGSDSIPGTEAPFFRILTTGGSDDIYGYFCSNCASTDIAGDGLDRLECGNCGNEHLPDEWDAAYL